MTACKGATMGDYLNFDNAALGKAILSLGEPDFAHALLSAMEPFVPVDHLAVVVFDNQFAAHLSAAGSRQPGNVALEAGRLYERARFYRHDPGARQLGSANAAGGPVLSRLRASDITDPKYRREIYDRFRLLERLSLMDQVRDRWLMLNLYRSRGSEPFREDHIASIRRIASLLMSLAGKHAALIAPTPAPARPGRLASIRYLEELLAGIEERLTPRERAVCARALAGQTVHGVASELGIKPPTVATLRRRAYSKLNISSLNELFARCMEQLARRR
jgi:DNA-binding CsgD family transcriptional regulator